MTSRRIRKAVFPVAGLGTRFLPATKAIPKEMLPIIDRPLIQYAVDEAIEAGCDTLVFITNRYKHAVADYFDKAYELEQKLERAGKTEQLELVRHVLPEGVRAIFVTQAEALGLGHAIDVYKSTFKPLLHTLGGRPVRTHIKLIVDARTDKVLGCHIFGDHAAEIIQIVAVTLKMGATKKDFDSTIALHPTAAEELVTMRTKSYSKEPDRAAGL